MASSPRPIILAKTSTIGRLGWILVGGARAAQRGGRVAQGKEKEDVAEEKGLTGPFDLDVSSMGLWEAHDTRIRLW